MTQLSKGQEERIQEAVKQRIEDYSVERPTDINFSFAISNPEDRDHIVRIGTSILCTRWEIGYPGGSFAQAIANNNLMETFGRADAINLKCIQFYVSLIYNQSYIE